MKSERRSLEYEALTFRLATSGHPLGRCSDGISPLRANFWDFEGGSSQCTATTWKPGLESNLVADVPEHNEIHVKGRA